MTEASVVYAQEPGLDPDDYIDLLHRSGLAARRPVRDVHRIQRMIEGADILLTARDAAQTLIGIARSVTDHAYCCYLSDLAVDVAFQKRGIGRELIEQTRTAAGPDTKLILLSAEGVEDFYAHIGMQRHGGAFLFPPPRPS